MALWSGFPETGVMSEYELPDVGPLAKAINTLYL